MMPLTYASSKSATRTTTPRFSEARMFRLVADVTCFRSHWSYEDNGMTATLSDSLK